jgi:uncharacterized OB-fold protein
MSYVGEASIGYSIFYDQPDDGQVRLSGSRCPVCGDIRFPQRRICPNDLAECQRYAIRGEGIIYETVLVHLPPAGFSVAYRAGYIDLDDGVRVFAHIAPEEGHEPASGDRVALTVGVVRTEDGGPVLGPIFRRIGHAAV